MLHVDPGAELINAEMRPDLDRLARALSAEQTLQRMEAVRETRARLATNAAPLLALEAMAVALRLER